MPGSTRSDVELDSLGSDKTQFTEERICCLLDNIILMLVQCYKTMSDGF